jgi:NADH-ubiquinone oxidoreductase chain 3
MKKARAPFSLRFFLVTIIFLVFDAEIALILPLGLISLTPNTYFLNLIIFIIIFLIIRGLLHE